jgi:hypothetical protein
MFELNGPKRWAVVVYDTSGISRSAWRKFIIVVLQFSCCVSGKPADYKLFAYF